MAAASAVDTKPKRRRRRASVLPSEKTATTYLPSDVLPTILGFASPRDVVPIYAGMPAATQARILRQLPVPTFCEVQYQPPSRCLRGTTLFRGPPDNKTQSVSCLDWCFGQQQCMAWVTALIQHLWDHSMPPPKRGYAKHTSYPAPVAYFTSADNQTRLSLRRIGDAQQMFIKLERIGGVEEHRMFNVNDADYNLPEEATYAAYNYHPPYPDPRAVANHQRRVHAMMRDTATAFCQLFREYLVPKAPIHLYIKSYWDIFTGFPDLFRQDRIQIVKRAYDDPPGADYRVVLQ